MSRIANDTAKVSLPESWTNVPNKQELDEVENRLQKNITDGDTTLQNNLDAAEATLQGNIDTEVDRAKGKETELLNKFNSYTPTIDVPGIKVDNAVHADNADNATNDANGKNIDATYAKIENTYNKEEVDQKVSSVYTYKGSVATKADLPKEKRTVGDVYDVKDSGINYAWNGTDWDALGMEIDLDLYAKKIDVPGIKVNNAAHADNADNATEATHATNADNATEATHAAKATDSDKLGGVEANKYAKKVEMAEFPVATIIWSGSTTVPDGFLLCDGREITAQQYPRLYTAIGTDFDPKHKKCLLPNQLTADGKPRALYGADSGTYKVGTYIAESLPNHDHVYSKSYGWEKGSDPNQGPATTMWSSSYSTSGVIKTFDINGQKVPNTVYKDGANVFSNGIAVNMYIKY